MAQARTSIAGPLLELEDEVVDGVDEVELELFERVEELELEEFVEDEELELFRDRSSLPRLSLPRLSSRERPPRQSREPRSPKRPRQLLRRSSRLSLPSGRELLRPESCAQARPSTEKPLPKRARQHQADASTSNPRNE